jgi:hypothetical protein
LDPLRIYIDNSVVGGCHDEEFDEESIALFDMAREGKVVLLVSELLLDELDPAPPEVREVLPSLPQGAIERVEVTEEAEALRDAYLAAGVVGPARARDALVSKPRTPTVRFGRPPHRQRASQAGPLEAGFVTTSPLEVI